MPISPCLFLCIALTANPPQEQSESSSDAAKLVARLEEAVSDVPHGCIDFTGETVFYHYSGTVSFVRGKFVRLVIAGTGPTGGWSCDEYVITTETLYVRRGVLKGWREFSYETWKAPVESLPIRPWGRRTQYLDFMLLARAAPALTFRTLGPLAVYPANRSDPNEVMFIRKRWPSEALTRIRRPFGRFPVFVQTDIPRIAAIYMNDISGDPDRRAPIVDAPEAGGIAFPDHIRHGTHNFLMPSLRYRARTEEQEPRLPAWLLDPLLPEGATEDSLEAIASLIQVDPAAESDSWLEAVLSKHPASQIGWEAVWTRALRHPSEEGLKRLRNATKESSRSTSLTSLLSMSIHGRDGEWEKAARKVKSLQEIPTLSAVARPWQVRAKAYSSTSIEFNRWLEGAIQGTEHDGQMVWVRAIEQALSKPRPFSKKKNPERPKSLMAKDPGESKIPSVLHLALARDCIRRKSPEEAIRHFKALAKRPTWMPELRREAVRVVEQVQEEQELCDVLVESGAVSLTLARRYLERKAGQGKLEEAAKTIERMIRTLEDIPRRSLMLAGESVPGRGAGALVETLESQGLPDLAALTVTHAFGRVGSLSDKKFKQACKKRFEDDLEGALKLSRRWPFGFGSSWSALGLNANEVADYYYDRADEGTLAAEDIERIYEIRAFFRGRPVWKEACSAMAERFADHPLAREMRGDFRMADANFAGALEDYERAAERARSKSRTPQDSRPDYELIEYIQPVGSESDVPKFNRFLPLWVKLAMAARSAGDKKRGIGLLRRFARPGRHQFAYQTIGRSFEIVGEEAEALRYYWLALLSGEVLPPKETWTYSLPIDEIARRGRQDKRWRELLVTASLAKWGRFEIPMYAQNQRKGHTAEGLANRIKSYREESEKHVKMDELIAGLSRSHAADRISPEQKESVEKWLNNLGSQEATVRDAATETLRRCGSSIAPLLTPALKSADLEKARRTRTILTQWAIDALVEQRLNALPWP